jgi:hypothetical protein
MIKDFEDLIGGSIADLLEPFVGADNPINNAICSVLYKMQDSGTQVPKGFTVEFRQYLTKQTEKNV